jgi:hypothetical protein
MCGRFTIAFVIGLYERFNVKTHSFEIVPKYIIAPSQDVPVVIRAQHDGSENDIKMSLLWRMQRVPLLYPIAGLFEFLLFINSLNINAAIGMSMPETIYSVDEAPKY